MPMELIRPKSLAVVGDSSDEGLSGWFAKIAERVSKLPKVKVIDLSGRISGAEKSVRSIRRNTDVCFVLLRGAMLAKCLHTIAQRCKVLVLMCDVPESVLGKIGRFLGPNSAGLLNREMGLFAIISEIPPAGRVSLISQRRGATSRILRKMSAYSVGVGRAICTGEGRGIPESEILKALALDKNTTTICLNIHRTENMRPLLDEIGEISKTKHVLLHLTGSDDWMVASAVKQRGGIYVRNVRELVCGAKILSEAPPLMGERIALLSRTEDLCIDAEKHLAGFSPCTLPEKILRKTGMVSSGFGYIFESFDRVAGRLQTISETSDGILLLLEEDDSMEKIQGVKVSKTLVVVHPRLLHPARYPIFQDLEDAVLAMKISLERGRILKASGSG